MKKYLILFIFLQVVKIYAHPHVFINHTIKIVVDQNGLAGFQLIWVFDEMFSSMLIQDFDKNKNGKIDTDENSIVKKKGFDNLREYHYFVFVKINSRPFYPKYVHSFQSSIVGKRLVYSFFVPVTVKASGKQKIELAIKDPSNYADLTLKKNNPVTIVNSGSFMVSQKILDNRAKFLRTGEGFPEKIMIQIN